MFRIRFLAREKVSMRDHLVLTLGNERAESVLESENPFVYPIVSYDSLEMILYVLYT